MSSDSDMSRRYRWRFETGAPVTASAALTGDAAYLGAHDGIVHALDVQTGQGLARSQPLGGKIEGSIAVATVAGRPSVLVPCGDGSLTVLDAVTLAIQQQIPVGGRLRSTPAIHKDMAYVSSEDGFVAAVDLRSATVAGRWRARMGVKSTPARWGWLLLIGSRDGRLYAFDARHFESEPVWTVATRHQVHGPPVVDERLGQTCFGSLDETVYAVDRGGCIRWQQRLGGQIMGGLALDGGRLFVGATDHKLYALNAATGQPLWEPIVTGDWIVATPAVWRGLLIFGSNDGHLYMADAAQGKILWRFPAGGAVQAQPAVTTEGLVVVGTSAGAIYGLPWHLRNYVDAATWLEGQRGGEAEAGELWLRAGNQDRAFACLRHAAAWARLAEAAEGAGRYGEAAHAYEQLAASRSGTPDVLAGAYRQAAQMWDTDSRPGEALRCRRESARLRHAPLLVLEPQPLPPLYLGDHTTLSICLRNEGTSAAHGILVQATGHLRTQRRIETPPLLPGGERLLTIDDIEPGQSGTAQVIFMAEYYDANGRVEEAAKAVLRLQVLHRPVQEFHYHGDHVEGDKITGDKVEGDQVKIERKSAGL